jgi:hypothetical protein
MKSIIWGLYDRLKEDYMTERLRQVRGGDGGPALPPWRPSVSTQVSRGGAQVQDHEILCVCTSILCVCVTKCLCLGLCFESLPPDHC